MYVCVVILKKLVIWGIFKYNNIVAVHITWDESQ